MKKALLVPWVNTRSGESGYTWETPSEKKITDDFKTRREALNNAPAGFKHYEGGPDGWGPIPQWKLQ